MSVKHTDGIPCPSCWAKLAEAHPELAAWFGRVKTKYTNVHVSWSYRGATDQEQMFLDSKTHLHYPDSAHNKTGPDLKPCSRALDLFLIDDDGVARFPPLWYAKLDSENQADQEHLLWGGSWKHLGDFDHFEMEP